MPKPEAPELLRDRTQHLAGKKNTPSLVSCHNKEHQAKAELGKTLWDAVPGGAGYLLIYLIPKAALVNKWTSSTSPWICPAQYWLALVHQYLRVNSQNAIEGMPWHYCRGEVKLQCGCNALNCREKSVSGLQQTRDPCFLVSSPENP